MHALRRGGRPVSAAAWLVMAGALVGSVVVAVVLWAACAVDSFNQKGR